MMLSSLREIFCMKKSRKLLALMLALTLVVSLCACGNNTSNDTSNNTDETNQPNNADIETALDLANIKPEWTYSESSDAWTMAVVTAVTNAELPDYQGVSVCVPGAYVKGVDTDGDGTADATSGISA